MWRSMVAVGRRAGVRLYTEEVLHGVSADGVRLVVPSVVAAQCASVPGKPPRLDQTIAALTGMSRRAARGVLAAGSVSLNGSPVKVLSRKVYVGDVVDVTDPAVLVDGGDPGVITQATSVPAVNVAWENRDMVFVDKPPGLVSQPSEVSLPGDDLFERTLRFLGLRDGTRPWLHMFHRLDRGTSGLVLFTLTKTANRRVDVGWQSGAVTREYVAVVRGNPTFEEQVVSAPIGRVPNQWKFRCSTSGKPARTELKGHGDGVAIVRAVPVTGRTHQIRVHLSELGFPVLGDTKYGEAEGGVDRPLLHSWKVTFDEDLRGYPVAAEAPLPPDIRPFYDDIVA